MFSFLKSKPLLKDLIPSNFVDIHSHLLPNIDDGAKNINDTILLINKMKSIGFDQFITTPHVIKMVWDNTKTEIETLSSKTISVLEQNGIQNSFRAAAEYMMDIEFVNLFKSEPLLTLKDNYVLVEMSYINAPIQLYDIIFELQLAGYIPVLAHPERYQFYFNNFNEYLKLKKVGCLFQLNLLSAVGYYGLDVTKTSDKLLENDLIDFVGSDIHHENHIANFDKKVLLKEIKSFENVIEKNQFFRF